VAGISNLEQQKRNIIMIAQLYKSKLAIEKCEESLRASLSKRGTHFLQRLPNAGGTCWALHGVRGS
jgi:hypothetical protein